MQKRILSLLVDNTAGVLSRISGLFSRRGYNIDSLTVGVTADERYSRMTVVCSGDSMILEQITKQLAKLVDVRDIKVLEPDNSVSRELVLVKVAARPDQREGIISIANIFRKLRHYFKCLISCTYRFSNLCRIGIPIQNPRICFCHSGKRRHIFRCLFTF